MMTGEIGNISLCDNICLAVSAALVMTSAFLSVFFVSVLITVRKKEKEIRRLSLCEGTPERVKSEQEYPIGTRVMVEYIDKSDKDHIIKYGDKGTVQGYDDLGHLFVAFDNALNMRINPEKDFIHKLKGEE